MVEKYMYYDIDSVFKIYPPISFNDDLALKMFIIGCPFWKFENGLISVSSSENVSDNEIFNQLSQIFIWLSKRSYIIDGEYYGTYGNIIESISARNSMLNHHIMFDTDNKSNTELSAKIITTAKYKIKNAIRVYQMYKTNLFMIGVALLFIHAVI